MGFQPVLMYGGLPARCATAALSLIAIAALLPGCAAPGSRGAPFPQNSPVLVWPHAPDPPRIRYIGEIRGAESLGRRPTVGEVIFGASPDPQRLVQPLAVACHGDRLAVADPPADGGPAVFLFDLAKKTGTTIRTVAGKPLVWPIDIAFADGRLAIADAQRAEVLWVDAATGQGGGVLASGFGRPASVAWNAVAREWWVVDAARHELVNLSADGRELRRVGGRGAAGGQFNFPAAVAADGATTVAGGAGTLGVADAMNFRVQLLDAAGAPLAAFGQKGDGAGDFALPRDVAFDRAGHVYVLDSQFENVQVFDAGGRLLLAFGEGGLRAGEFNVPSGLAIDERSRIWIADTRNRRVQAFEYIGE